MQEPTPFEKFLTSLGFFSKITSFWTFKNISIDARDTQKIIVSVDYVPRIKGTEQEIESELQQVVNEVVDVQNKKRSKNISAQ